MTRKRKGKFQVGGRRGREGLCVCLCVCVHAGKRCGRRRFGTETMKGKMNIVQINPLPVG